MLQSNLPTVPPPTPKKLFRPHRPGLKIPGPAVAAQHYGVRRKVRAVVPPRHDTFTQFSSILQRQWVPMSTVYNLAVSVCSVVLHSAVQPLPAREFLGRGGEA